MCTTVLYIHKVSHIYAKQSHFCNNPQKKERKGEKEKTPHTCTLCKIQVQNEPVATVTQWNN